MTDPIEQIWTSPANQQVSPQVHAAAAGLAANFATRDAARRRRLMITGPVLTLFTAGSVAALFDAAAPLSALAAIVLLAISWAMWGLLWAQGRPSFIAAQEATPLARMWESMRRRNAAERRTTLLLAAGISLSLLPLWWAVAELQAEGQASAREGLQLGLLLSAGLCGGLGFVLWRYFANLRPESVRLTRLAAEHAN